MLTQDILTDITHIVKSYAGVFGDLDLTLRTLPEMDNTQWIYMSYEGRLESGREVTIDDRFAIISTSVDPKQLGLVIGARIRTCLDQVNKQLKKAG